MSGGGSGSSKAPPPARWTPTWVWVNVKEAALHYWHGSKLLYADIRIASKLLKRIIFGRSLSRREHKLLVRVSADIARLVPLLFFVIVPLAEFALPFAIRLFPNLLPSTFEEKHHAEEKQKKMLKVRMEMAQFLQHTLDERATQVTAEHRQRERLKEEAEQALNTTPSESPRKMTLVEQRVEEMRRQFGPRTDGRLDADVREFMVRMKEGGRAKDPAELLEVMRGFKDNVTLDHLYRDQLIAMAQFLNMNHFAPTALLRFQIRQRLRRLRNEDKEILWEGIGGLSETELRTDLRNRGLPTKDLNHKQMQKAMEQWLSLSQEKEIPYSLLILTNMLHFTATRHDQSQRALLGDAGETVGETVLPLAAAQAAMSSLPTEMAAMSTLIADQTSGEKLEALHREEELVEEERIVLDSAVDKLEDRMFAPDTSPETTSSSSAPAKLGTAALSSYKEGGARYDAFEKAAAAAQIPLEAADRELEAADLDLPAAQYMANAEALSAAGAKGPGAVPGAAAEAEPVVHLTREQIANLAEAIDTMIDSPIRMEREEMAELEAERVAAAGTVEEAKKSSRAVKLLDSRVQSMMDRIKTEMEASEVSIGAAFHKLDLDGDGMLSKGELLKAMEELEPSRRPDAHAFEALLVKMDTDQDGQISVGEIRKLIKDMREIADVTDEENTGVTPGAKA